MWKGDLRSLCFQPRTPQSHSLQSRLSGNEEEKSTLGNFPLAPEIHFVFGGRRGLDDGTMQFPLPDTIGSERGNEDALEGKEKKSFRQLVSSFDFRIFFWARNEARWSRHTHAQAALMSKR